MFKFLSKFNFFSTLGSLINFATIYILLSII